MQKLEVESKNAPRGTSLASCSATFPLNREEILSVEWKSLTSNNLEVNPLQHAGGRNLRVSVNVYVLNKRHEPLMPTTPRAARKLIQNGKAKVVRKFPFTIQLTEAGGETKQGVICGVDTGYQNIGISVVSGKKELFSGELTLENKTSERLTERRMYRRLRRNKLWYRKPRFNNRKRKSLWLPPSVQRRFDCQTNFIKKVYSILPISELNIEVANFDIQKLNNPEIEGKEYQQGNLYGYENMKSFLLSREKGICQFCGKKFEAKHGIRIHHIIPRSEGGTDKPDNLSVLHEECHKELHRKHLEHKLKKNKQYKPSIFMSIVQHRFKEAFPEAKIVFGYETKIKRIELELEKSHVNDAFVIADGNTQIRSETCGIKQKHRNNRAIQLNRKGFKPSIRRRRYSIQPSDLIWVEGKKYIANGVYSYGKAVKCHDLKNKVFNFGIKKVKEVFHFGSLIWN
jgi:hypothetical protein